MYLAGSNANTLSSNGIDEAISSSVAEADDRDSVFLGFAGWPTGVGGDTWTGGGWSAGSGGWVCASEAAAASSGFGVVWAESPLTSASHSACSFLASSSSVNAPSASSACAEPLWVDGGVDLELFCACFAKKYANPLEGGAESEFNFRFLDGLGMIARARNAAWSQWNSIVDVGHPSRKQVLGAAVSNSKIRADKMNALSFSKTVSKPAAGAVDAKCVACQRWLLASSVCR